MGSFGVKLGDYQMIVYEGYMHVWFYLLAQAIEHIEQRAAWLEQFKAYLIFEATVDKGYDADRLEEYIKTEERRQIVLIACDDAISEMVAFGRVISPSWLNLHQISQYTTWNKDLEVDAIREVAELFIEVVREGDLENKRREIKVLYPSRDD